MRVTSDQLYNVAVAMNLAKGEAEHDARTAQFISLFETAWWPVRLAGMFRVLAWRLRRA